ncbi:MAG: hypothetical protein LBF51_07260 [Zoogloeaceae bacterium]|jgi:hypothetical protein|nr:hypothetical protein [Zoogloeaceae bacterium]
MMLAEAGKKTHPNTPEALSRWLADQEVQILRREFAEILRGIDELRQKSRRIPN